MTKARHRFIACCCTCVFAISLFACSSLLGFDDLTSAADAANAETAAGDASIDTTGMDVAAIVPPGAPSNAVAAPALVTTLAGSGTAKFADGTGSMASFDTPVGVAVDANHNVYVADSLNHRIRKISPAGVVTTLAGSGTPAFVNATGAAASFDTPTGVALDAAGNVYVADSKNNRIRKVSGAGVVETFAGSGSADHFDGTGTGADFNMPRGVTSDPTGNLYVADTGNHRIRKVKAMPAGETTSPAGSSGPPDPGYANGQGQSALFHTPTGIAIDAAGVVFICDSGNERIRQMTTAMDMFAVLTLAGSGAAAFAEGTGVSASFSNPMGAAVDGKGNVYVADAANHRIRKVTSSGVVSTLAGSSAAFADGTVAAARFDTPGGIAVDADGKIYVGDTNNHRIRRIVALDAGQLEVSWTAPASPGSAPITGYTATAVASGASVTCTAAAPATTCTLSGLTSGASYSVSVTATNGATSAPSPATTGTPN